MGKQTKTCQNCSNEFTIEPEDFEFYNKIQVPAPTWCPECRMVRRMMWRNERILYKRKCDATGKEIFSMYSLSVPIKVYDEKYWWSDNWDAMEYGRDYDFNKPFFEQLKELILDIPMPSMSILNLVRSDYCNNATNLKDCYLVFGAVNTENSLYCTEIFNSKDCYDSAHIKQGEISYEGFLNRNCYNALFSSYCSDSYNIIFCHNCIGVSDCFGCVNLRKKQYHIFNKPYSKEEYFKKIKEFNFCSFRNLKLLNDQISQFKLRFPVRYMRGRKNVGNISGEYINNSKNVINSYLIDQSEDLKFCWGLYSGSVKDSYDYSRWGTNAELIYDSCSCGDGIYTLRFCYECWPNCKNLTYCLGCHSSSDLFACIGLRNKQYCILNKQYTKEEYEKLVPKIIEHMNSMPYIDKKGRIYKYGELFPFELSPFAYNETIAQEYFPLTKEQAIEKGYKWKESEERNYNITIKTKEIPDHIKDVKDNIISQIIQCAHYDIDKKQTICNEQCSTAFKIIPRELEFYKKQNIPIPRLCPNCRYYQRIKQRNPLKLWNRKCQCEGKTSDNGIYKNTIAHKHGNNHCETEFETSYSPERKEIVYCEKCYQQEVV